MKSQRRHPEPAKDLNHLFGLNHDFSTGNKQGKRRIVVDGHLLYWSATGNEGGIRLSVTSDFESDALIPVE